MLKEEPESQGERNQLWGKKEEKEERETIPRREGSVIKCTKRRDSMVSGKLQVVLETSTLRERIVGHEDGEISRGKVIRVAV